MSHLPTLITDLALILVSAGIITLLFKWLKQPLVLGYIVAGLLAGPYVQVFPTVGDIGNINTWAEIGVVFLLFALGLEFSFKKLVNVGSTAFITAITEVVTMLIVGYLVGYAMGWSTMNCIFLGGMLSMSSTTIIIKAFDDMGLRGQRFTGIVFGTLVVEDLVAILMMVLLSTMAVSQQFAGEELAMSVLKVVFFLVLWFLIGIFIIPLFLKKVKRLMNDETLLIIALGLCLGMVVLATETGFSAALGAFIMGSILAETVEAEHIEHIIKPVKDLFGAIFFVSVGMLVDPAVLVEYALPVAVITLVTIVGKACFSTLGVLLSGQTLKTSVKSGFSLAQIGEFAFIIASLGVSLKVLDDFVYPIIVAVSVITTFTTPYFIRLADPFAGWLYRVLPDRVCLFLDRYASGAKTINHESDWKRLLKSFLGRVSIYSILLTAIFLLSTHVIHPFMIERFPDSVVLDNVVTTVVTLLLMTPFLIALISNKNNTPELFMSLWNDSKYNRGRLVPLVLFRVFVAILFVSLVLIRYFHIQYGVLIIIAAAIVALITLFRRDLNHYMKLERRFMTNLNQREEAARRKNPLKSSFHRDLSDKDIHLAAITVSPNSAYAGLPLDELAFRERYGVSVVEIIRGDHRINIPDRMERIYPQDRMVVVGTDEQIQHFSTDMERIQAENKDGITTEEVSLQSFTVDEAFAFRGQTLAESNVGNRYNCLIVGIERDDDEIMNPTKHTVFQDGDLVWVVGEKDNIRRMIRGSE
ncbi:cation:proton antiporter [Butyricimonas synergistica]|uniref:cation:proton antiporter n=1 Tax=Butyricimonas synergistica TaxID=544644 RepID=UPI00037CC28F|nr:cation:proton antiporter [Butyricimonas synergistica]